jgi:transcriptional regulator with XRE-family HTH domain
MSSAETGPRIPREMYPDRIGARMRLIREAYGLKPAEIADMLGIERTYWSRFEGGRRPINDEVAYLLVDRFKVTLDFLILGRWETLRLDVAEKLREAERSSSAN